MRDNISETTKLTNTTKRPTSSGGIEHIATERITREVTPKLPQNITHNHKQLEAVRGIFQKKQSGDPELLLRQLSQHRYPTGEKSQNKQSLETDQQVEQPNESRSTSPIQQKEHTPVDIPEQTYSTQAKIRDKNTDEERDVQNTYTNELPDKYNIDHEEMDGEIDNPVAIMEKNLHNILEEETESSEEILALKEQLALSQERYHELALAMVDAMKGTGIQLSLGESKEKEKEEEQKSFLLLLFMLLLFAMETIVEENEAETEKTLKQVER